jgi:hypothetical protein
MQNLYIAKLIPDNKMFLPTMIWIVNIASMLLDLYLQYIAPFKVGE